MKKEIADLVDAAIPAVFGLLIISAPRGLLTRGVAEHELEPRLRKVRVIGGALVTVGAVNVAIQLIR